MENQEQQNSSKNKVSRGLNLLDSSMLIIGSMIGSGIFIVSAQIARDVQTPGMVMLNWVVAGIITVLGALSYGELAAAMPKAGGQYVYLKEAYNKFIAFLYGWTLFAVIQTGTIAAVGVGFAKFTGVFIPAISAENIVFQLGSFDISTQRILAISTILLLTFANFRSVKSGAHLQNFFTFLKIASLLGLIIIGLVMGFGGSGNTANFSAPASATDSMTSGMIGIFFAAMVGSLFSADAWNNITFTAGEVQNPQRNLPRSLILGTGTVMLIYLLANAVYFYILPIETIKAAPQDRVATLLMQTLLGNTGAYLMAAIVMISTFGCLNGIILTGARVYYAMAKDGLFFRPAAKLNKNHVPAYALVFQAIWACGLTLTGSYGNLLDYVMFAVILFYIFTVAGLFILRKKQPDMPRPYKVIGYPFVPALYIILAVAFCVSLLIYKSEYTVPGLGIVLLGIPLYFIALKTGKATE
ncbi:MAG: amino acid permease [Sphingobacteriales bacterium]|nr:MAG: amino acid permease [Sphingobacteriales bacterium]